MNSIVWESATKCSIESLSNENTDTKKRKKKDPIFAHEDIAD